MSPVRLSVPTKWVRLVCLVAFFAFVLSTLPVHRDATAQGSRPRRTQGPPGRNLPNLDETRGIEPGTPRIMPPVPATKCRGRDEKCKKAREKISSNLPSDPDRLPAHTGHRPKRDYPSWLNTGISALSAMADLIYWPAREISNFPNIPHRDGVGALVEAATKSAYTRSETYGNAASGSSRKEYGYRSGRSLRPVAAQSSEVVWFDDSLPAGAVPAADWGDGWNWVSSSPAPQSGSLSHISNIADWSNWSPPPYSGNVSHQSNISSGFHQHQYFSSPTPIPVRSGGTLYAYIYIDPENIPQEVMLQWGTYTDGWEHRAYWGANIIDYWGTDGTASRRYMGPLPAAGGWVRLEVPASAVGLEGMTVGAMAFTLYGGRANWDLAGISGVHVWIEEVWVWNGWEYVIEYIPHEDYENYVLVDDSFPAGATPGADGGDSWNWRGANNVDMIHQHYFHSASNTLQVSTGDKLFTWVYLDPAYTPSEAMLQWHENGSWEHRAYWGANKIGWGVDGTASRRYMGPLPPGGQWVRLEVEASAVGLEGKTLNGMAFTLYGGRASWDKAGKMDTTAPVISNVVVGGITATGATITWNTNENSDSQVEYRTNTGSWQPTTLNPTHVTAHTQGLSGLTAGTLYYYRVKSRDAAGNLAVSVDFTFTTSSDTTLPTVTSFSPTAGATNVNANANVTVIFSEAMNATTVNGSTIELRDPSNALVPATVSYNAVSFTATLDPTASLSARVTYTARVRGGGTDPRVKDLAGNALAADVTWTFTTDWPTDLNMALIDPMNHIGSPGKDLFSRNCNWSLPLLGLPGRAGMDLGLALSLNSLIYTRAGSTIHFDPDHGFPAPGFRLGFPEIRNAFTNTDAGAQSYLLSMPSGHRVEFRQVSTNVYETVDSSYRQLTHDPVNMVFILRTTDGTQFRFEDVTGQGEYKCKQIKDRNGNFITISYGTLAEIRTVTDTTGRPINFNYDASNHLLSITQNWGGQTHTWATFAYGTQMIQTNFQGLTLSGTTNGEDESVLMRVGLADGSVYSFEYNTYAQVKKIKRWAPKNSNPVNFPGDYSERSYITYGLPDNASASQTDCPRATFRTDWAYDWNEGVPVTSFYTPGPDWGQVEFPDGTKYKEFFETTGWQRGLTKRTENWTGGASGVRKKWTTIEWIQDNTGVSYRLNPRVKETIVHDDANNRRRREMFYTSFGLVSEVREYDADTTTLLRSTQTEYNLSSVYTSRRIIGLPSARFLKDGSNNLFSKITYVYDLNPNPNPYLQHPGPTAQHDTANYGPGFVQGRGNLNRTLRWDVTDEDDELQTSKNEIGYNTSGSVIFTRDPLNHETTVSYTDSFSDGQNRNTYAYPTMTTINDPDEISSTVQYNYYFGAVTRTQDPKEAVVTFTYDAAGRIARKTNEVNGAYTLYVYAFDQRQIDTFTTINDLNPANEFRTVTVFDGHDRVKATRSDHPGSVGQYKAQYNVYNVMGRLAQQSNPTEVNSSWEQVGDDEAGWAWTSQSFDWQGRLTLSTNQDGTTKEISYGGCGCAGGDVVTITDEGTTITDASGQPQFKRRQQKIFHDVLGRVVKTQVLNWENGSPYSTTINTYNVRDQIVRTRVFQDVGPVPDDGVSCPTGACQKTESIYDGHGRLSQSKLPIESGFTTYTYRPDDMVETSIDPRGVTTMHSYNNRRLLTGVSYSGGGSGVKPSNPVTYEYNELGQRTKMTDGLGNIDYNYNTLGQMESETRVFSNLSAYNSSNFFSHNSVISSYTFSYEYNLAGQLKKITDPWQSSITYQRDKAGQVISVTGNGYGHFDLYNNTPITQFISGVKYRAWGAIKEFNTGTVASLSGFSYQYNARLLTTNLDQGERATTQTYHNDGFVKDVTDHFRPVFSRYSEYDHVGRLKLNKAGNDPDWTKNPFLFTYEYNVFGNTTMRTGQSAPSAIPAHYWSEQLPEFTSTWTNNRDHVLSQAGLYDALGNVVGSTGMNYNQAELLARETRFPTPPESANLTSRYYYDGDGERGYMNQYFNFSPDPPPPDGPTSTLNWTNHYYLRSTPLGGLIVAEFDLSRDVQNRMWQSYSTRIYFNGEDIAYNKFGFDINNNPTRTLMWKYRNPFTGSVYSHIYKSYAEGAPPIIDTKEDNTTDAVGAPVAAGDPALSPPPPPMEDLFLDPIAAQGDIHDFRASCRVDGAPTPCAEVLYRINNNPGMFILTRINHRRFMILPQPSGAGDFRGVAPYITDLLPGQGGGTRTRTQPQNQNQTPPFHARLDKCINELFGVTTDPDHLPPERIFGRNGGRYQGSFGNETLWVDINTKRFKSGQLGPIEGEIAGKTYFGGITEERDRFGGVIRHKEVYVSSDYADNSFMKVDDRFIQATAVHEVGNALYILTKMDKPPRPNHANAFREPNAGAALEDCVYGGKVKKDGTIRTTNWQDDPSSRDPRKY